MFSTLVKCAEEKFRQHPVILCQIFLITHQYLESIESINTLDLGGSHVCAEIFPQHMDISWNAGDPANLDGLFTILKKTLEEAEESPTVKDSVSYRQSNAERVWITPVFRQRIRNNA